MVPAVANDEYMKVIMHRFCGQDNRTSKAKEEKNSWKSITERNGDIVYWERGKLPDHLFQPAITQQ